MELLCEDGTDRVLYIAPEHDTKFAGLYNIQHTIGRGHYAVVKLARHVFTGEKVAVKVIDKTKLDCIARDHLFQEVVCMKLVQHPNVVRLYEVIDTPNKLYLILELGDGGDLYDYIMKHGRGLDERAAKRYFRQVVTAIAYCHKLHVVHRDLKPENVVFFEKLGLVKLTDFGFSNKFIPGTHLDTHCGSLAYSAPEILLGEPYDAPKVDVWSLGVILFMLVCGRLPFEEANDSETLTKIMDCEYTIPTTVSPMCASLIKRLLVAEPEQRARLDDVLQDDWLRVEDHDLPIELFSVPLVSQECLSFEDHMEILAKMSEGQLATVDEIQSTLDSNEYNHIAATYYLLAERKLKRNYIEEYKRLSHQAMLSEKCKQLQQQPQASQPQSSDVLAATNTPAGAARSAAAATHEERVRRVSMILEDEEEEEKEEAVERVRLQQAKRQRLSSTNKSHSLSSWRFYGDDAQLGALPGDAKATGNSVDDLDVCDVYSSCCIVEPSQEALLAEEEEELVTVASLAMVRSDLLPDQSSTAAAALPNANTRSTSVVSAGGVSFLQSSHTRPQSRGSMSDGTESDLSLGNWSGYGPSNITGSLHYASPTARSLLSTDARRRMAIYRRSNLIHHRPLVTVKSSPQLLKHIMEEDRSSVSNVSQGIPSSDKQQTTDQYIKNGETNTASILDPSSIQSGSNMSFDEQVTKGQLQRLSSQTLPHSLYLAQQRPKTTGTEVSRSTTHSPSRTRRFFTSPSSSSHPSRPLSMGSWNLISDFQRQSNSTSPIEPINPLPTAVGIPRRKLNTSLPVNHSHSISISDRRCSGPSALMLALYNRYNSINPPPGITWSRLARSRSGSTSSCAGEGNRGVFELTVSELEPAQNSENDAAELVCPSGNSTFESDARLTIPPNFTAASGGFDLVNGRSATIPTDPSTKGKVLPTHDPLEKAGKHVPLTNTHMVLDSFPSPHKAASWCSFTPLHCEEHCGLPSGSDSVRHCATPPLSLPMTYPVSAIPLGLALREILCTPIREEDDEHSRPTDHPLDSTFVKQPGLPDDSSRSYRRRRRSESSTQSRPVSAFSSVLPRANSAVPSTPQQPIQSHQLSFSPDTDLVVLPTSTPNDRNNGNGRSPVTCGPGEHEILPAATTAAAVNCQFDSQQIRRQSHNFTTSNFSLSSLATSMRDSRHMFDVVRGAFELQCYYQRRSGSTTAQSVTDGHSVDGFSGHTSVSASARSLTALFENFPLKSGLSGDFPVHSNPRWSQFHSTVGLRSGGQTVSRFVDSGVSNYFSGAACSNPTEGDQPGSTSSTGLPPAHHLPSLDETLNDSLQLSNQPSGLTSHNKADLNEQVRASPWQSTVVAQINPSSTVNSVGKVSNTSDQVGNDHLNTDNSRNTPSPLLIKSRFSSLRRSLMHQLPGLFHKSRSRTPTPTGKEHRTDSPATDDQRRPSISPTRHFSPSPPHGNAAFPRPTACLVAFDKDGDLTVLPVGDYPTSPQNDNNNNCDPDPDASEPHRVAATDGTGAGRMKPHSMLKCCIIS